MSAKAPALVSQENGGADDPPPESTPVPKKKKKKKGPGCVMVFFIFLGAILAGGAAAFVYLGYGLQDLSIEKLRGLLRGAGLGAPLTTQPGPSAKPLDVSFIAPEFTSGVIVHPARLAKAPLLTRVPQDELLAPLLKEMGIDPRKIEQAILLIEPFPGGEVLYSPAGIIRFAEPVDGKQLLSKALPDLTEVTSGDQKYFNSKQEIAKLPISAYIADDRTLLIAPEPTLKKMLAAKEGKGSLVERFRHAELNNDIIAVFVMEPETVRQTVGKILDDVKKMGLPPEFAELANLHERVKSATLTLNLSGESLVKIVLEGTNEESAAALEKMLRTALDTGKKEYLEARKKLQAQLKELPPDLAAKGVALDRTTMLAVELKHLPPDVVEAIFTVADQVVDGLSVSKDGVRVSVTLPTPKGLDHLAEKIAPLFKEMAKPEIGKALPPEKGPVKPPEKGPVKPPEKGPVKPPEGKPPVKSPPAKP
jgi:hypothetical protein